ncbi:putative RNA methyltransferase [Leifsonia sp. NPDC058248]|uniref:putative RNA methyltransferase n=1 Tax=Leifsonia sp. NPDC058248 TaxID=3346402 RepID=UPI0036D843D2
MTTSPSPAAADEVAPFLRSVATWLRCPTCGRPLEPVERLTLGCASGHRFDANKRGYVSLLAGSTKVVGDNAEMLDARAAVLDSGLYSPIAEAVASSAAQAGRSGARILDAGAGTGYYLRAALAAVPRSRGLALDLSPVAVARAVRASPDVDGLVADTWRPLPVRDGVCDIVLDVFAPRNLPEFHRILAPAGSLVVVVPTADHLAELRADGGMLDVPADKAEAIAEAASTLFDLQDRQAVRESILLDDALSRALAGMGPSAHHRRESVGEATRHGALPATATISVEVLRLTKR